MLPNHIQHRNLDDIVQEPPPWSAALIGRLKSVPAAPDAAPLARLAPLEQREPPIAARC